MSKQFHGFTDRIQFKGPIKTKMIVKHLLIPTWDPTFTAAREPPTSAPNIGWLDQDAFAIDSKSWALLPALGATFQVSHR
jgi:hypothetical protein